MKKQNSLFFLMGCFLIFSCSKKEVITQQESTNSKQENNFLVAHSNAASSSGIKGVNWACPGDNYSSSTLVLSGLNSGNSYNDNYSAAITIASQFSGLLGANTVRIPINYATVNTSSYWGAYKGVIDGILAAGMKVIICFWTESSSYGYVTNWTGFESAWSAVLSSYGSNSGCYFEILNEPYSYSTSGLISMYGTWLSDFSGKYSSRSHVLCGGTGYDDHVVNIGGNGTINGCLYSQHVYAFWATYNTNGAWQSYIEGRIGSRNYSNTVITEMGCTMNSGLSFYGVGSTNNEVCYFQGVANACRNDGIAACYWPGLRAGDNYSMTTINGTTLSVVNTSGKNELGWAYGN